MLRWAFITLLFLSISGTVISASGADAEPGGSITIGVILPLTGDMAAVGSAFRDAAMLGLKDASSGARHKYELRIEDDKLTPNEVAKVAQKMIAVDKVSAIISTWSYGGSIVSPLAERAKIPHIGVAWDHRIADGEFNFLHLSPPAEFMGRFLDAFKKLGVKRVALLGIQESGSVFALDEFTRLAPSYGIEVVYRDAVLWNTNDFVSLLSRIRQTKPDYLLYNLGGDAMNLKMLTDLKKQHVPFPFTAITSFDVLSNLNLIEGRWYVSDSYLPDDFAARFKAAYGHDIRYGIGNFYEAVRLLVAAFESSKDASPVGAKDELLKIHNQPSLFGPTSVDARGIFSYPARYMRVHKGKREQIALEQINTQSIQ